MATILYAEDDRDCRELFAFVLRQKNYTVYEANNGAQAVQIAREEPVDLAILDVRMPMMTGYEAAHLIAQEHTRIPIIFLSVKSLSQEVGQGFQSGNMVVDYLVKPISIDYLAERVDEILQDCQIHGLDFAREKRLAQFVEIQQFM